MMEPVNSLQVADGQSQPAALMSPSPHVPPTLRGGESHHVFISYSSTDYHWTHSLIDQLESCGLQVCHHERDFTPGRTVLENMSECIHCSQKVLLVLSPEFVRSRWCLLEANMSLFKDCLERKPIVPVLLEPNVSVPLHLCHLTYLEASDPDFKNKLLRVLCAPNEQLQASTVVPFQPPSIYNGKVLQPLTAVNDEELKMWDSGRFVDTEVPDQLRLVIQDQEKYKEAARILNSVSQNKVRLRPLWLRVLIIITGLIFTVLWVVFVSFFFNMITENRWTTYFLTDVISGVYVSSLYCISLGLVIQICIWFKGDHKYIVRELQKAVGQANTILSEEKVLMGCSSNSKIYLVYVSLNGCKQAFAESFGEQVVAEHMFQRALLFFSSGYAYCLAKRHFPFPPPSSTGHLEGQTCFCQYVSHQLSREEWK